MTTVSYTDAAIADAAVLQSALKEARPDGATFDSGAAVEAVTSSLPALKNDKIKSLVEGAERFKFDSGASSMDGQAVLARSISSANEIYRRQHGADMSPGVLAHLLHTAGSMTLDSGEPRATNISADPRALHPRVPLIAMMTMANVLPPEFVSFLPANPSGEAVLGVVTHTSGSTYGAYKAGDSIDGQFGGKALFTPRREHILSLNAVAAAGSTPAHTACSGRLSAIQEQPGVCKQSPAPEEIVPFLNSRAEVYVNGVRAAVAPAGTPASNGVEPISGQANISGTDYLVSGSWNFKTGEIATLTVTPQLPNGSQVVLRGVINWADEGRPPMPTVGTAYRTFTLWADESRFKVTAAASATDQFAEIGLTPIAEAQMAALRQVGLEAHYEALDMMWLAANAVTPLSYDMAYATRSAQLTRNTILSDIGPVVVAVDQDMISATNDHGSSHVYVGQRMAGIFTSMPPEMFIPSGLPAAPGLHWIGTWMGKKVYLDPRISATETASTSKMLFVGAGSQPALSPVLCGSVSGPVAEELGKNESMAQTIAFRQRSFASRNPFAQMAQSARWVQVINMG